MAIVYILSLYRLEGRSSYKLCVSIWPSPLPLCRGLRPVSVLLLCMWPSLYGIMYGGGQMDLVVEVFR